MKRELGIARCGLACCLCSENTSCAGCNSGGNVRIKTGVKTENVHWKRELGIVMHVTKTAKKDY